MKKEKFVLYLAGGAMAGVFGAGVVTRMQELDLYSRIEAIYGTSAGAFNAAYFLARQTRIGASIYYEDISRDFICKGRILPFMMRLFLDKDAHSKDIRSLIDIDYLLDVARHKKILDTKTVQKQKIPFYVKVLGLDGEIRYISIKDDDVFNLLRATICVAPYTFVKQKICENYYIDGDIKELLNVEFLRKKYPKHKIIVVINEPLERFVDHHWRNIPESIMIRKMYGQNFSKFVAEREKLARIQLDIARSDPNMLLIYPDHSSKTRPETTEYKKLINTYEIGQKEAEKILPFIEVN